jgi:hypothetical protein
VFSVWDYATFYCQQDCIVLRNVWENMRKKM